jgi:hypothetical protein
LLACVGLLLLAGWATTEAAGFAGIGPRDGALAGPVAIAAAVVVLVAAFLSSIAGFAFSALAGGALAHLAIDPVQAVRLMAVCSLAIQSYAVWNVCTAIRWRVLWPMVAAGATTVPLGVWLLVRLDPRTYAAALGLFLAAYGAYVLVKRGTHRLVRATPWRDALAGGLGGLAGGLAGFPGSFVTVWCSMRGGDKLEQRAIYQPYILAMQVVTLACLQVETQVGPRVSEALAFVPFAVLGAIAGLGLFHRLTNAQFRVALSSLLVIAGAALLARAV